MVLMVLDHTRDFLSASSINPRDFTDPFLFMTRWVTHICAPVFVFLAGVSAWLTSQRHGKSWLIARYLLVRGIWLILLELTVVRFGWTFELAFNFIILQVIWVLGWGMIFLSLFVALKPSLVGVIGVAMITMHNLFDPIQAASLGRAGWLWHLLHEPHLYQIDSARQAWILYPLVPWIGVLAFGFGFAPNLVPQARRSRFFYVWGAGMVGLFLLLRFTGVYGDPTSWQPQPTFQASLLEFLNCEKYPPSLQFLLMTLGPVLFFYPLLKDMRGWVSATLITFGEVPLFFYLIHLPVIHALAILLTALNHQSLSWLFGSFPILEKPADYGIPLPSIYLAWLLILCVLYPACRWYSLEKLQRRKWWHRLF